MDRLVSFLKRLLRPLGLERFSWARKLNQAMTERTRTVRRDGLILTIDRYDGGGVMTHRHPGLDQLLSRLRPDDCVLDVGAHIGYYALRMAQKAHRVYALEASRETFLLLVRNVTRNSARVTPLNIAADRVTGETSWVHSDAWALSSLIKENTDARFSTSLSTVPAIALDDFPFSFSVLKLDAEGADMRILEGAPATLKRIRMLLVECWPWGLEKAGSSGEELQAVVRRHFPHVVDARTGQPMNLQSYSGQKEYTDLFAWK